MTTSIRATSDQAFTMLANNRAHLTPGIRPYARCQDDGRIQVRMTANSFWQTDTDNPITMDYDIPDGVIQLVGVRNDLFSVGNEVPDDVMAGRDYVDLPGVCANLRTTPWDAVDTQVQWGVDNVESVHAMAEDDRQDIVSRASSSRRSLSPQ